MYYLFLFLTLHDIWNERFNWKLISLLTISYINLLNDFKSVFRIHIFRRIRIRAKIFMRIRIQNTALKNVENHICNWWSRTNYFFRNSRTYQEVELINCKSYICISGDADHAASCDWPRLTDMQKDLQSEGKGRLWKRVAFLSVLLFCFKWKETCFIICKIWRPASGWKVSGYFLIFVGMS